MSLLQMPKADFCCCCCVVILVLPQLKRCGLGYNLVSALTNVRKYVAWEGLSCEKAAGRASNLRDTRDWDLFADSEYRRLVETEDEANGGGGRARRRGRRREARRSSRMRSRRRRSRSDRRDASVSWLSRECTLFC